MAEIGIINATQAALAVQGETTAAWTVADSTGAPTNTETLALVNTTGVACMIPAATAAQKMAIAMCLIDNVVSSIDLSSRAKRKAFKLKQGAAELKAIADAVTIADQ